MAQHQNDSAADIKTQKDLFNGTIDIIKQVLGKNAFLQYDKSKGIYIDKFSPSIVINCVFFYVVLYSNDSRRDPLTDLLNRKAFYGEIR